MFKEFSKISPHNHFGGRNADYCFNDSISMTRVFDIAQAESKLDSANNLKFQLLGFTNHNHFWKNEFESLKKYINDNKYQITLIPGVEFDLMKNLSDSKRLHVVLLISDILSNLSQFENDINVAIGTNSKNAITIDQLVDFFFSYKCILIPHGNKQQERGAIANSDTFSDIISVHNYIPIMVENKTSAKKDFLVSRFKSILDEECFEWLDNSASVSSADQSDFSNVVEPTYIWAPPSFDALFYCAIIGEKRFFREQDIIKKNRTISKLVIKNNGGELQDSTILFSHGLNSIVGNSGSGKTLLLNLINKKLTGENLKNSVSSSGNNYESIYNGSKQELFDSDGNEIKIGDINVFEGESLYKQVVKTLNLNKGQLLKEFDVYANFDLIVERIKVFNTKFNTYLANRRAIIKSNVLIDVSLKSIGNSIEYLQNNSSSNNTIEFVTDSSLKEECENLQSITKSIEDDLSNVQKIFEELSKVVEKYKVSVVDDDYMPLKNKLIKNIRLVLYSKMKCYIILKAKMIREGKLYEIVNNYNAFISERSSTINASKQTINNSIQTIVSKLKSNALLKKEVKPPILFFNSQEIEKLSLQNDFSFIKLDNFTINYLLDYDRFTDFFETSIGSSSWKLNKSLFSSFKASPLDISNEKSVESFAQIFIENDFNSIVELKYIDDLTLLKYDTLIKKEDGEYKNIEFLSAGELSKIYINVMIDKKLDGIGNSAIILYDQPDNNLEKAFILESLVRKLNDLKKKYQIILTTHEPLLVVNADSNSIIKVNNDPVAGKNNISFENVIIFDSSNKNEAIEKVSRLIDGHKDAVKLRNKIYGGNDIW